MKTTVVTFRLGNAKKKALDSIAEETKRNRTFLLNEAVDAYLDSHDWQIAHIRNGLRQAEEGRFATDKEVRKAFARWRR